MTQAEATFSISTNFYFKSNVDSNTVSLEHSPNIEETKKFLSLTIYIMEKSIIIF